jgi:hypothetical protein
VALIKCRECGKEVSDKAAACPGCGAPIGSGSSAPQTVANFTVKRSGGKWEAAGTVLVIAGVLSVMFAGPPISTIGSLAFVVGLVVFVIGRFN